jgi:hypothetical protein
VTGIVIFDSFLCQRDWAPDRVVVVQREKEEIGMRRTEILAAAAAAAQKFRRMFGSAVFESTEDRKEDRKEEKESRHQKALNESTAFLFVLELLRLSEASAEDLDVVFPGVNTSCNTKRKEAETDLFWLGLHLLDREISARYDRAQWEDFMDVLMQQLFRITTYGRSGAEVREIQEGLVARAGATRENYSRFQRIYPEEHKPVVRTLLWEFTKSIAINYRGDYRDRSTLEVFGIVLTFYEAVHSLLA